MQPTYSQSYSRVNRQTDVVVYSDSYRLIDMSLGGRINERLKNIRFNAVAGPHTVADTFLHRSFAEHEGLLSPTRPGVTAPALT